MRNLMKAMLCLIILILAGAGNAPAEGRKITRTVLDNGLTVVMEEDRSAPVVALQMWVRVGSADEKEGEYGLAHVFEHMLFKGTAKRGVGRIASETEAAGGNINAYTSFDTTVYHITLPSRNFGIALDIMSDAIQNSSFDPDE
ncbi:MAG TPA: insulinase family protein, partial [Thermodesulfobacteriota bacterium]|nr:insulinase family protein [Thermodesulfobacteriota bacterium]